MSKAIKWLMLTIGTIPASILGRVVWESSLCDRWRGENPLTKTLNWQTADTRTSWLFLLSLMVWSLVSFVYILRELRRARIHTASYDSIKDGSIRVHKDITEFFRKRVEKDGIRSIQVENELLDGDPDFGNPKILTVDYSIWGRRKKKEGK